MEELFYTERLVSPARSLVRSPSLPALVDAPPLIRIAPYCVVMLAVLSIIGAVAKFLTAPTALICGGWAAYGHWRQGKRLKAVIEIVGAVVACAALIYGGMVFWRGDRLPH